MRDRSLRRYKEGFICIKTNRKTGEAGTIDVEKGCIGCELKDAPCYAAKMARISNVDFYTQVSQTFNGAKLESQVKKYKGTWVRLGCTSDPSLNWKAVRDTTSLLSRYNKIPVIITKVHKAPSAKDLISISQTNAKFQVTFSGVTPEDLILARLHFIEKARKRGTETSIRIVSSVWKRGTREEQIQKALILLAKKEGLKVVDTPLRTFRTSPLWSLLDEKAYRPHISPISGKKDSQSTAGLIIDGAYPCFSTCSPVPTETDPIGCAHQCLTSL